jgi:hypothetical protein
MSIFYVDPIEALLQDVARRWPDANVRIQFSDEDVPEGALAVTSVPEKRDDPAIVTLRPDLAGMMGTIDVLRSRARARDHSKRPWG